MILLQILSIEVHMKYNEEYIGKVKKLADFITSTSDPKMKWMWGEALLGYALDEFDKENGIRYRRIIWKEGKRE